MIAIDPSSPISGGAVLGDRIRMGANAAHENVFIRSFSARGELGGLSRAARAAVDCLRRLRLRPRDRRDRRHRPVGDARSSRSPTRRVVVCPPGLGDDVQAIKAGTLEIADVLAVSKGDLPLAEQTAREMREMLALRRRARRGRLEAARRRRQRPRRSRHRRAARRARRAPRRGRRRPARAGASATRRGQAPRRAPCPQPRRATRRAGAPTRSTPTAGAIASPASPRSDGLCATLGIAFRAGGPGRAEVAMTVDARHLNFNGGCHGGAIFSLADSAFGLASNSHGPVAAGIDAHITFQAGGRAPATRWSHARPKCSAAAASASTGSTSSARTRRRRDRRLELHRHGLRQGLRRTAAPRRGGRDTPEGVVP